MILILIPSEILHTKVKKLKERKIYVIFIPTNVVSVDTYFWVNIPLVYKNAKYMSTCLYILNYFFVFRADKLTIFELSLQGCLEVGCFIFFETLTLLGLFVVMCLHVIFVSKFKGLGL